MENTISGASANTAEEPVTAENSQPSPKSGKKSTRKTKEPITQGEALELLTSALSYCLESGLNVIGYNEGSDLLRLSIEGAQYRNNRIEPATVINVTPNVTPVAVDA
jgi:hypothetical protein